MAILGPNAAWQQGGESDDPISTVARHEYLNVLLRCDDRQSYNSWPMEATDQVLEWAEEHIKSLAEEMEWHPGDYGGYWKATDPRAMGRIRARATAALHFLERFTGANSSWSKSAHRVFTNKGENQSMESGVRAIGDVLEEWIRMVRSGQIRPRLVDFSARAASSTDLLEQVRTLNSDLGVAPAAPIVLAGAALEIALRSAVEELDLTIGGRPSISVYARTLRKAEILNKQDMKEVEQMAGLRNDAAHGNHDLLSHERSGLMEQQVNSFLNRLEQ